MRFEQRMSDHEALMWNIEKDPWLNPNGGAVVILDRPIDTPQFVRRIRYAVAETPRLREKVAPGLGRLSPPTWVPDPEFDLDYHIRELRLPEPGTDRQLLDLTAQLYEDPLDRTRPLWRFVLITGLSGGRGALWTLMHHTVADGMGQLRMAEMFQELSRQEELPPEVDLDAIITEAATSSSSDDGGNPASGLLDAASHTLGHLVRRQAGVARRVAGELSMWPADPRRARDSASSVVHLAQSTIGQMTGSANEVEGGSPIWAKRSRRRHLEALTLQLDAVKSVAKAHKVTINDIYVAGLVEGAIAYHAKRGVKVDAFNTSFVLSTRTDNAVGGNSFTPVPVQVSGREMGIAERISDIHDRIEAAKADAIQTGGITALSGVVNLLPTSVVTQTVRGQAAKIDFATSNLRGASIPLYVSGALVLHNIPMGPVAGTAANITTLSYNGVLDVGLFIDPVAITDPADFRGCIESAFSRITSDG